MTLLTNCLLQFLDMFYNKHLWKQTPLWTSDLTSSEVKLKFNRHWWYLFTQLTNYFISQICAINIVTLIRGIWRQPQTFPYIRSNIEEAEINWKLIAIYVYDNYTCQMAVCTTPCLFLCVWDELNVTSIM